MWTTKANLRATVDDALVEDLASTPGTATHDYFDGTFAKPADLVDSTGKRLDTFAVQGVTETKAAVSTARPQGGRIVFGGDSLSATSISANSAATVQWLASIQTGAMFASGGRLYIPWNAAVAGNTSAQLLARFQADVIDQAPDAVHIMIGTNDAGSSISLATYSANIKAMIAAARAAGIFVVISNVPPRGDAAAAGGGAVAIKTAVQKYNAFLAEYCAAEGIPLIDVYAFLVDPATGGIKAEYNFGDQIHFTPAGYNAVGAYIWSQMAPYFGATIPQLARDAADPTDLLAGAGLFLTDASGLGTGWSTGDAAHTTFSTATDAAYPGRLQQVAPLGTAAYQVQAYKWLTGWAVGDVVEISGVLARSNAVDSSVTLSATGAGSANIKAVSIGAPVTADGVPKPFRARLTIPAGSTGLIVRLLAGPAATTAKFGQIRVRNLTAMGALT